MERFAGRYGLLKRLGKGGMGEVHLVVDLETGAEYALKRLARREEPLDPALLQREFEALARVRHPAVVAVIELGVDFEGAPFLVMEYIPGWHADQVVRPGDWDLLAYVGARVAGGLEALHAAGVTHGDLKPANVLVVPATVGGRPRDVRIVDFGLAALVGGENQGHRGTPGFTAPEVVRGAAPDAAADLYAFGATLYTLAAGRPPFEDSGTSSRLKRQQVAPPSALALEEAGAPGDLVRLILQMMAVSPAERPRGARDIRHALEALSPAARWPLAERLQGERLVGREAEQQRIERAWRRAAHGARVVLVRGVGGSGKTALLTTAAIRGALESRSVIRVSGAESPETGAVLRAVLSRLAAEARVDLPVGLAHPGATELSPEAQERDLFAPLDAAAGWCRAIATRGAAPAILIDDADALDPLSRRALRRLMLRGADAPALWVLAQADGTAEAAEDERSLAAAGVAEALGLAPLSREAMARLVAARLQVAAPEALLEFLWSRAGGHPGWTVELLRAAAGTALHDDDEGVRVDAKALEALRPDSGFEAARLLRLSELDEEARAGAEWLAVFGRARSLAQLQRAWTGLRESGLALLAANGLATRDTDGGWMLTPPALARQILERVPVERRLALHRGALLADDLGPVERFRHLRDSGDRDLALATAEEAFATSGDPSVAVEASELAAAVDAGGAARWLGRAALIHINRGGYAAGAPLLERALELDRDSPERAGYWAMFTTCLFRIGDLAGVARAVASARREPLSDGALAVVLTNEAARLTRSGQADAARGLCDEAIECATRAGDDRALGSAFLTRVSCLRPADRVSEGEALCARAREAFRRASYPVGELRSEHQRSRLLAEQNRLPECEQVLAAALERAREEHLSLPLQELLQFLAPIRTMQGRWKEAWDAQTESLRIAVEESRLTDASSGLLNLAVLDAGLGEVRRARREARRAMRLVRVREPGALAFALRTYSSIFRVSGRLDRAFDSAERSIRTSQRIGSLADLSWARIELGRAEVSRGHWETVASVTRAALEHADTLELNALAALSALGGRAALHRGDLAEARRLLSVADGRVRTESGHYGRVFLDELRTLIHFAAGDVRRATEAAAATLRQFEAMGAIPDRGAAALEFARVALAGNVALEEAGRWLEIAVGDFERIGDSRGRTRALALQVELLRRSGAGSLGPERERDLIGRVARLLDSLSDFNELIQRAMEMAVQHVDAERGVLLLADPATGRLEPRAEHGAVDAATRREAASYSRRIVERVAESGGSLLIRDAPTDPKIVSDSIMNLRLRSILCVPMYRGGRVIGAVYLSDSRRQGAFVDADRSLLEGFAQLMATAIEKSRGDEEVRRTNEQLVGENLSLRQEVATRFQPRGVIGASAAMVRVLATVERAAQVSSTMLLTGENGTGKELIARVLHHSGRRSDGPFVAVNCGAIPEALLESELFGHVKGAFTDAHADRAGKFELANGGTLFLDEIGEMPLKQQVALLSVLSNREVTPVGGGKPIHVDVRVISATNQDLRRLISEGRFREDLFYRLNVIEIEVPALRDRKADIPALSKHFAEYFAKLQERAVPELSPEFLAAVTRSEWPGNVRELQNYVERVMAMTPGPVLHPTPPPRDLEGRDDVARLPRRRKLADLVADLEKRAIREALERADGNQSKAARELQMTEQALRYRLKKLAPDAIRKNQRTRNNRRSGQ